MKIAILADPLDNQRAGVHVFTRELITALIQLGYADRLLLVRERIDPELPVEQLAVPNIHLPIGFASLRLFFIIPYLLRRRKEVVAVFEPAHFGPFNLPKRIKRITMIHDLTPILFPQYHRWHSQLLQRLFLRAILKKTDWVLTNSRYTQTDVARVFPFAQQKVSHVYLGRHAAFKPTCNAARIAELGIKLPYFLNVGTLEPRKNLLTLLAAFELFCLKNAGSNQQLILVGELGWKAEPLVQTLDNHPFKTRIQRLGYVKFTDLPILYTHSQALIYPSEYEGFGLPIIEALACGTPVIAAQNSSLAEIGEGAVVFFPTHDAQALSEEMEQVVRQPPPKEPLIEHAAQFSWLACASGFMVLMDQLIGE
ncbi:MAG: hypothetical protein DA408_14380 [Bacteroidetes bacterium]|nr:MAG: hypothetical protein C7N36_13245 [Bacteroidota bacterium]PTM11078.1 MAG: hypothetical protein DA408_14380 [Bacteroidota bacterium]